METLQEAAACSPLKGKAGEGALLGRRTLPGPLLRARWQAFPQEPCWGLSAFPSGFLGGGSGTLKVGCRHGFPQHPQASHDPAPRLAWAPQLMHCRCLCVGGPATGAGDAPAGVKAGAAQDTLPSDVDRCCPVQLGLRGPAPTLLVCRLLSHCEGQACPCGHRVRRVWLWGGLALGTAWIPQSSTFFFKI